MSGSYTSFDACLHRSKTLANGEHHLMMRLTKGGQRVYSSLGSTSSSRHWNKCLVSICLCILSIVCEAQPQGNGPRIGFDHLTTSDGLSHNTVLCIYQDSYGYIWMGTQNGLNRYDGYDFEIYKSNSYDTPESGFLGKIVTSIFEDSRGNLWVGTRNHGLNVMSAERQDFVNLSHNSDLVSLQDFPVTSISQDSRGNIWVTSEGGGVYSIDPIADTLVHYTSESNGLLNDFVFDVQEVPDGSIYVATSGPGINVLQPDGTFVLKFNDLADNPNIDGYRKRMSLDGYNVLVSSEGSGMYKLDTRTFESEQIASTSGPLDISTNLVRDVIHGSGSISYLASDGYGLYMLDKESNYLWNLMASSNNPYSLNTNGLQCLMLDRSDNLWIGTFNGGVNIFKRDKTWFEHFAPSVSSQDGNNSILAILERPDGSIWLGTDGGGIKVLSGTNNTSVEYEMLSITDASQSIAGNVVKSLYEDENENIWIGMFATGLTKYNSRSDSYTHYPYVPNVNGALNNSNIWSIVKRPNGLIYLGTIGGGINILDPETGRFDYYLNDPNDPESLSENSVMVLQTDSHDNLWVGTANRGLNLFNDSTGKFSRYSFDPQDSTSLSSNEVRAVFEDSRGKIWIGTEGGGLSIWLGNGKFKQVRVAEGLISDNVMAITEDNQGNIWASTFDGLSLLTPDAEIVRNFNFQSIRQSNQFNHSAATTLKNGKVAFGGINGMHLISPDQIRQTNNEPKILITDLYIYNDRISSKSSYNGRVILEEPIERAETATLSYKDKLITLHFSTMDFTQSNEVVFDIKLDGFDENWRQTLKGDNSVTYTNLDPGSYIFKIKFRDSTKELRIEVIPPLWQKAWFQSMVALAFFLVFLLGMRIYVKRREMTQHQNLMEAERKILALQNEKLELEVSAKNSELVLSTVQIAHKNELLNSLMGQLAHFDNPTSPDLKRLARTIEHDISNEDFWLEFKRYFDDVDRNFVSSLRSEFPKLTKNDLRLCIMIRINLSTKEISNILSVSVRAIEQARYRLKRRLSLTEKQDLASFVKQYQPIQ